MIFKKFFVLIIFNVILTSGDLFVVLGQDIFNLQQALKAAKANNLDLKTQQYNIRISEADIVTARLRPNPVLNNQSLQLIKSSKFYPGTDWNNNLNRQVWWQLTKSIQLPMTKRSKINNAILNKTLSEKTFAEIQRNLFNEVAQKWLEVWTAQKKLYVLQISKNNADSLLKINQIRFRNQTINETDLLRTQVLSSQYTLQIKAANTIFKNEIRNLQFLLGVEGNIMVDTTNTFGLNFKGTLDSLIHTAFRIRSDLIAIKTGIEANKSNIRLQKLLAYPTPELGLIYNPQNTIPYLGLYGTIQIPIFSRNQGEIKKSQRLLEQSEQDLLATQSSIRTELSVAYETFRVQEENLRDFNGILNASQQILNNIRYAYLRGGTTIIDYLEAQRTWLDTQQQYYDTLQLYRESYIQLLYTSGLINELVQ